MHIALLHTAAQHVATFDALFAKASPAPHLSHHVAPEFLRRAQAEGLDAVRGEMLETLRSMAGADAVLCTCTTVGPIADEFHAEAPHTIRIDRPLMEAACTHGPRVLVAITLESTRAATLALLQQTAAAGETRIAPEVLLCAGAFAVFEAGDPQGSARIIAEQVRTRARHGGVDCIILAQASMHAAGPLLDDLGLPVFTSPALAAASALEVARAGRRGQA